MTRSAVLMISAIAAIDCAVASYNNLTYQSSSNGLISSRLLRAPNPGSSTNQAHLSYANLPLSFEPVPVRTGTTQFVATGRGYRIALLPGEARLDLFAPESAPVSQHDRTRSSLRLAIAGNPRVNATGSEPLPVRSRHFEGSDSRKWSRPITNYGRVRYRNIYPGIDLAFYGNQSQLEYDFIVSPGASPESIGLEVTGADHIRLDSEGNLILTTAAGEVLLQKPFMYQLEGSDRREVSGSFTVSGNHIGFSVGKYDTKRALIVDPVLSYATYIGRSISDKVNAIAVAADGSTYLAGVAPKMSSSGQDEAFVAHISGDGGTLLYITYLGGSDSTEARALALDALGNVFIAGQTKAADFPATNAIQPTCGLNAKQECTGDAFVARLNVDGSLDWATYLGGSSEDAANGIALDAQGNIYVAGFTSSAEFPVFRGFQLTPGGEGDAFVAKISADGAHVLYATYLGGGGPDEALGLAVDKESSVYVTGRTESGDFATRNAFQTACGGRSDARCRGTAFVSK